MQVVVKSKPGEEINSRILRKQIDLVYSNQAFSLCITFAIVALLFLHLSTISDWKMLVPWELLFVVVMLLRAGFSLMYFYARKKATINIRRAEILYLLGILLTGLFWSVITLCFFPILDFEGKILLLLVVTAFATGAHTTMGYLKLPVCSFILLLLVPMIYAINSTDFPGAQNIAIAMFLYLLFIFRSSLIFHKNTYDMLHLQELAIDREKELVLQSEKADSANIAKSVFLSHMSHELRTPLNIILGLSELQLLDKKNPLTEKQASRTRKIGEAGNHLLLIVNDVLDLSCIDTGDMEITLALTDLYGVVQDSIRLVEDRAALRNIGLSTELLQKGMCVMADKSRLKQVVVNLLDHCIKYNAEGGNISLATDVIDNKWVRLFIIDTGYDHRSKDIGELSKHFSQLDNGTIGVDGTGINLNLSKELVELMGGRINVNSRSEKDYSIWVELPYAGDKCGLDEVGENNDLSLTAESSEKVLLVEDNLVNSEVAVDMLEAIGVSADVAYNGRQAIDMVRTNNYSLIFMDCEMPVMDGFTTTKQLRKMEQELRKTRVPIVALTAHAITGAREKCIASGMDDFLSKPFGLSNLSSILNKWLETDITGIAKLQTPDDNSLDDDDICNFSCNLSILDCDTLSKLYTRQKKNNSDLLSKIIGIYLEQSSKLFQGLAEAGQTSDVESVRKISHTLKSSSINVGALKLSELCRKVEQTCEQGSIDTSSIQKMCQHYPEVESALKDVLQHINSSN